MESIWHVLCGYLLREVDQLMWRPTGGVSSGGDGVGLGELQYVERELGALFYVENAVCTVCVRKLGIEFSDRGLHNHY